MSIFSGFPLRDSNSKCIRRTFDINDDFYEKLLYLKAKIYDTSINKMISEAIKNLIETEDIVIYEVSDKEFTSKHSIYLPEKLIIALGKLNDKFPAVSVAKLVNIAIYRVIKEEIELGHLAGYNKSLDN